MSIICKLLSLVLLLPSIFVVPATAIHHAGHEHIVLVNKTHPHTPSIDHLLARLSLSRVHKDVVHIYDNTAFTGFSARMNSHCLSLLANTSYVTHLEPSARLTYAGPVTKVKRKTAKREPTEQLNTKPNSPWGLQRLSSSSPTIKGNRTDLTYTYTYASSSLGANTNIYLLDTGIFFQHAFFSVDLTHSRATTAWSFDGLYTDDGGHGTHVAGVAGGSIVGVAQAANLIGVRVLSANGGGSSGDVIKGVDWAIQHHSSAVGKTVPGAVLSLSLASKTKIPALAAALDAAVDAGIHVVAAAGNDARDACASSPSNLGGTKGAVIVVGSVGAESAAVSPFSNTGDCVDVYAAGEDIVSAWPPSAFLSAIASFLSSSSSSEKQEENVQSSSVSASTTKNTAIQQALHEHVLENAEIKSLDGTSMATPFVTGLVAYAIAANSTLASSPALMKQWVRDTALAGIVTSKGKKKAQLLLASNGVVGAEKQVNTGSNGAGRGDELSDKDGAEASDGGIIGLCKGKLSQCNGKAGL